MQQAHAPQRRTIFAPDVGGRWSPAHVRYVKYRMQRWREGGDGIHLFAREALGMDLVPQQQEMLAAVGGWKPGGNRFGTSVRSGKGVGKTVAASVALLWKLVCFRDSLVVATAPKERQLFDVLWATCDRLIRDSRFLSYILEWHATRIGVRGEGVGWQAIARVARQKENIAGEHRPNMLIVVEEASGVEEDIMEALMSSLTEADNSALLISNPTRAHGYFYDTHHKDKPLWQTLHLNARESPLVSAESVQRLERKYGADSPVVAVQIDGNFPSQSDTALIRIDWFQDARERAPFGDSEVVELGVDVARFGADSTVVAVRRGSDVLDIIRWGGAGVAETIGRVIDIAIAYEGNLTAIKVDEIGIGAGVVDGLQNEQIANGKLPNVDVVGVNVAQRALDPEAHGILRDELWFDLAGRLERGELAFVPTLDSNVVDMLEAECVPVEYSFMSSGARKVDSKDIMRKKLGHSPDMADALMLAFHEQTGGLIGFI